jgi:hypothetical protein
MPLTPTTSFSGVCECGVKVTYTPLSPRGRSRAYAPRLPFLRVTCGVCDRKVQLIADLPPEEIGAAMEALSAEADKILVRTLAAILRANDILGYSVVLVFPYGDKYDSEVSRYVSKVDYVPAGEHEDAVLEARAEPSDSGAKNAASVASALRALVDQDGYVQIYLAEAGERVYFQADPDVMVDRESMTVRIKCGDWISAD